MVLLWYYMDISLQIILAALYLRGAPRQFELRRSNWLKVEQSLRLHQPAIADAPDCLRADGLWPEALALSCTDLLLWAERAVVSRSVLTIADEAYPRSWAAHLGAGAPPALWILGELPPSPYLTIVGSRDVQYRERRFSQRCAEEAVALGYSVSSGAAKGCDQAASKGAPPERLVEVLPHGLGYVKARKSSCLLSLCPPDEEFSTGAAMERNALLYALGEAAVIVHARFKTGGTWHGAVDAQRRRFCTLIVREDASNPAHRALVGLGAAPIARPEDLAAAMAFCRPLQPRLVC